MSIFVIKSVENPQLREAATRYRQAQRNLIKLYIKMKYFFLLFPIFIFSQTKVNFVSAKSKADVVIGQEYIFGCKLDVKEILKENEPILLYGYFKCEKDESIDYYNAYWNNDLYFIKTSNVKISEQDEKNLKSIDSLQKKKLLDELLYSIKVKNEELEKNVKEKVKLYTSKGNLNGMLIKTSRVFDQSEYTSGTGYEVSFANISKKTIKYVWFNVKGINAVDDVVSLQTVKCIGPIKPNEEGLYTFDYVWFTDIVEKSKLTSVKIQYMDGSVKQIQNPNDLIINETIYNLILGVEQEEE
ncbi:MAG: hypothetical protein O9267_13870 [Flavobacterium sp.]|uniref:hypothetical protein n=1 Tax=Flavobacterium sp. TaxID=239 RepID=UPI0022C883B7|nr:hypothetical protein [Flavobacterium sp.]MCZ8198687.1 hypothetical protein [Flavobacterium sp.]